MTPSDLSMLKERLITAITDAMPGEMDMVSDRDFANAADNVLDVLLDVILRRQFDQMIDLVGVEQVQVMISAHAHRLWVCTENGSVLRVKADKVLLDDQRVLALCDGCGQQRPNVRAVLDGRAQMCPMCIVEMQSRG
jgi:hypothetical protein